MSFARFLPFCQSPKWYFLSLCECFLWRGAGSCNTVMGVEVGDGGGGGGGFPGAALGLSAPAFTVHFKSR